MKATAMLVPRTSTTTPELSGFKSWLPLNKNQVLTALLRGDRDWIMCANEKRKATRKTMI